MARFPSYKPSLGCWGSVSQLVGSPRRPQGPMEGCPRESEEARALSCPPCPPACSLHAVRGSPPLFDSFSPSTKSPSAVALGWRSPVASIIQEKLLLWGTCGACRVGGPSGCQSWPLSIPASTWASEATEAQGVEMAWPRPLGRATMSRPRLCPHLNTLLDMRRVWLPPDAFDGLLGSPSPDRMSCAVRCSVLLRRWP